MRKSYYFLSISFTIFTSKTTFAAEIQIRSGRPSLGQTRQYVPIMGGFPLQRLTPSHVGGYLPQHGLKKRYPAGVNVCPNFVFIGFTQV